MNPVGSLNSPSWFDAPERAMALRVQATALAGTPFAPCSEVPGPRGGMDCVHLLNFIDRTVGLIPALALPSYRLDAGLHSDRSLLIEAFETWPELVARFACVWRRTDEPEADRLPSLRAALRVGDHLCFLHGRVPHHGGILLARDEFVHTLRGPGVHAMRLDAVIRGWNILGQLMAVYRPKPDEVTP